MLSYIYSWLFPEKINKIVLPEISFETARINLITEKDLLNAKLKPINVIPSPARNMPNLDKFTLHMLSKAQLDDILAVKLKKTEVNLKKDFYEPQHPVLRELLCKIPKIVC